MFKVSYSFKNKWFFAATAIDAIVWKPHNNEWLIYYSVSNCFYAPLFLSSTNLKNGGVARESKYVQQWLRVAFQ